MDGLMFGKAPLKPEQLDLFNNPSFRTTLRQEPLVMDADTLRQWKARIFDYQRQVSQSQPPKQETLFDLAGLGISGAHVDPDTIDPFGLLLQPMSFWRKPTFELGQACLYFVIDNADPLVLLYTGESAHSSKRWKGTHDAKRYIDKYIALHRQYGLSPAVSIAFWFDAPVERKARLQLELALILRWRSPFNKENWQRWGQPFG
jgi:hypothetical protein